MAAASGFACTLVFEFEQCQSDGDCARFASDGDESAYLCSAERVCVPADAGLCSNAACAEQGENFVCGAAGTCVQATSEQCPVVYGDISADNVIILGSILPLVGDLAPYGAPQMQGLQMAINEFNASGALGQLRFAHVGCDQGGNNASALAGARHLSEVLGVPVIHGPAFSGPFMEVAEQVTVPAQILTMSSSATSAAITTLVDDGLAWRTVASDSFQSVAMVDRILDLQAASATPLKVAAFAKDDPYGTGLLFAITERIGGEFGEDRYFGALYPADAGEGVIDEKISTELTNNFADADIVVLLGTAEIVQAMGSYELFLANNDLASTPTYIMSDGGRTDTTLAYLANEGEVRPPAAIVSRLPELATRVEGTNAAIENGTIYDLFRQRFTARWSDEPGIYASNGYDAAYLMLYALATLRIRGDEVSGPAVAGLMGKMIDGTTIAAGPSNIGKGLPALAAGGSIDFEGASGPLDFDLETGEAPANINRWIIETTEEGELEFVDQGQYVVDASGSGEWNIPE